MMDLTDDRDSAYLTLVGDLCIAAARASLRVELELADGTRHTGVPRGAIPASGTREVDDTGYEDAIWIEDSQLPLVEVTKCVVWRPRRG